ncbi:MAG: histidine phosphatase family protein [Deltaproteobacteria bacterium]|jgi:probable phosphoglycerate mutase|nr:histidine phosphatase family protein [Deltaproteobacteria bacterium]
MTAKITIYIVRHGQTEFNIQNTVQGFSDSPLTEQGRAQAAKLGRGLKGVPFSAAFASDLGRQRDTARLILAENDARQQPELAEVYGLREWNCGGFEEKPIREMWSAIFRRHGLPGRDLAAEYKQLVGKLGYEGIIRAINECDPTGAAETYEEIMSRAKAAMRRVVDDTLAAGGGNALVVTSGGLVRSILHLLVPGQYQDQSINNCAVTILRYDDGKYTLESVGDESYVK